MAIATCETLRTHGFKIPEDVIVTGYDGLEDIYYSVPQITSCACDYPDVAREVAKLLSEIFQGTTGVCTKKCYPGKSFHSPVAVAKELYIIWPCIRIKSEMRYIILRKGNRDYQRRLQEF